MSEESIQRLEETPLLARLGLTPEEWAAIRRRGFVSREQHRGQIVFKLRFRVLPDKKQRVRHLGGDPGMAVAVQQELARVQMVRQLGLQLGKLKRQIGRKLRRSRREFAPQLEQAGFYFHGGAIRQRRRTTK